MPDSTPKPQGCEVCGKTDSLVRCSGCQVIYYCGSEHFLADQASHKVHCAPVKKARKKYEVEEQKLRDAPPDIFLPEKVFETCAGSFWGIIDTRPYMRARNDLAHGLLLHLGQTNNRPDVVATALDHFRDMLRLCRGDNIGVRYVVPALYVRLNRDQEAYDFLKWWATRGSDFDWGDMSLPYLDIKGADAFEPVGDMWSGRFTELSLGSMAFLIKARLLLDLKTLQTIQTSNADKTPDEVADLARERLSDGIVASRPDILTEGPPDTEVRRRGLEKQLKLIYDAIHSSNEHYWSCMIENPCGVRHDGPFVRRSRHEAELTLEYNYRAWKETPGALELVKELTAKR